MAGLDIKTMAEQWKGFTKILQLYLEPLRGRLDISFPLTYLSLEISNNLEQLTSQVYNPNSDHNPFERCKKGITTFPCLFRNP